MKANVISYEEYYPYGDTSYRSARSGVEVSEKRYRYTGKEKDEETGLYYHGARYYAAWLGRWTAADPAGMVDGACLYAYVRNHPTGLVDPDGRAALPSGESPTAQQNHSIVDEKALRKNPYTKIDRMDPSSYARVSQASRCPVRPSDK